MRFIADFHIHSKYSRATSKECNIPSLYKWAKIKGITVLGTGDFTHPAWFAELKDSLIPDGNGLFNVTSEIKKNIDKEIPSLSTKTVKFILSAEISSIYKKNGKVRKIHNVIIMPDFESVEKFNKKLSTLGNITSDGRPILGIDSKTLLEITLEINQEAMFIPAHIWTPWFSLFGANSGFDSIEECFEDLTSEIFALETGLSSDPPMNWRLSTLDKFNLVSNSDAHSPANLAREANLFDTELSYNHIRNALKNKNSNEFIGTIEFYPQEGKYHYDGHRNCNIRLTPKEAIKNNLICPVCGKPITVGVLHRVESLADREEGVKPENAKEFESIVPLSEIIGEALSIGKNSPRVKYIYNQLVGNLGDELSILREVPIEEIKKISTVIIAEGIKRVREKKLTILPGFDGKYGKIIIFTEEERNNNAAQMLLLSIKSKRIEKEKKNRIEKTKFQSISAHKKENILEINKEQHNAIKCEDGPVIVIAGPGTGKTYTLIERILHLIKEKNVAPENILAITFTNKAANEIKARIGNEVNITVGTFHTIALLLLKENNFLREIFDDIDTSIVLKKLCKEIGIKENPQKIKEKISLIKTKLIHPDTLKDEFLKEIFLNYRKQMERLCGMDYDDIIIFAIKLLNANESLREKYRKRFKYILVDEFQDINFAEYKFIKLLAGNGKNLFVIGDPDQSIYQFRGANPDLFFKLKEDFPQSQIFSLKLNYRNPEVVLKSGLNLILKISKSISSENDIESKIQSNIKKIPLISAPTELSAGIQIAKIITSEFGGSSMQQTDLLDEKKSRSFSDFAILVRAAFLIPLIEEVLIKEGIPYRLYGEKSFFEKKLPRAVINILRLCNEGFSKFRFLQVLNFFNNGERIIKEIESLINEKEIISKFKNTILSFKKEEYDRLNEFIKVYEKISKLAKDEKPETFFKEMAPIFGEKNEDYKRLQGISERFDTIKDFLQAILTGKEQDIEISPKKLISEIEAVSVMTIHSAKGLQFPVVFVYGINEEILPYKDSDINEERRLFYVAITRAKEKLYLVAPQRIKIFGQTRVLPISHFINDIPEKYIERKDIKFKSYRKEKLKQLSLFE